MFLTIIQPLFGKKLNILILNHDFSPMSVQKILKQYASNRKGEEKNGNKFYHRITIPKQFDF